MKAPQEFFSTISLGSHRQKVLIDSKTEVVGLPLLCGENIGQSGQRGFEVDFSDPFLKFALSKFKFGTSLDF